MTQSDTHDGSEQTGLIRTTGPGMGRRRFMQAAAMGVGAAATGASASRMGYEPVGQAEAVAPIVAYGGAALAGGLAGILLERRRADSALEEAEADEVHDRVYADAVERDATAQTFRDSISTNVNLLGHYLKSDVAFEIAQSAQLEEGESAAVEAGEEAVNDAATRIQRNLINEFTIDRMHAARRIDLVRDTEGLDMEDVVQGEVYQTGEDDYFRWEDVHLESVGEDNLDDLLNNERYDDDFYLFNGETINIPTRFARFNTGDNDYPDHAFLPWDEYDGPDSDPPSFYENPLRDIYGYEEGEHDEENIDISNDTVRRLRIKERDGDSYTPLIDPSDFMHVMYELREVRNQELDNVQDIVDSLYQPIVDGDVDAHDIASGSAIFDAADEMEHYGHAAGHYRAISMPEAETPTRILYGPEGEEIELEGILFWTHPDEDGLPQGEWLDPGEKIGEIHMAAEVISEIDNGNGDDDDEDDNGENGDGDEDVYEGEEGDIVLFQLSDEFMIEVAHDWGTDPVTFVEREVIDPEDDPEDIVERLQEAYEAEQESREERQDIVDSGSGGGGWFPGIGGEGGGIIAGVIVLLGIIFGISQLGD